MVYFEVTQPTSELVEEWWNWVFTPDRDTTQLNPDVTFLRGDLVGAQRVLGAGIHDTPTTLIPCCATHVRIKQGGALFFPVYDSQFTTEDPFGDGKPCGTIERCLAAAQNDFANLYEKWATFYVDKGQPQNIVDNLDDYYIETPEITIDVPADNLLNREAGFNLAPNSYKGISVGIFLLLTGLKAGIYTLDFGGRATNYFTRSVCNIIV